MFFKNKYLFIPLIFIVYLLARYLFYENLKASPINTEPDAIVSYSPSITETLYILGLGKSIKGVTNYCNWPEDARNKPHISEYNDLNLEAMLNLRPQWVILPGNRLQYKSQIENLGISVLYLNTLTIQDYLNSVQELGQKLGCDKTAQELIDKFNATINAAAIKIAGKRRPRVLFVVERATDVNGQINEVCAVGSNGFFSELLEYAGGENVYKGKLPYPRLSKESIMYLQPDIIVDIVRQNEDKEKVKKDWQSFWNGKLFFLSEQEDTVPGPRSISTLNKLVNFFIRSENQ